jgi:hypothetical protein
VICLTDSKIKRRNKFRKISELMGHKIIIYNYLLVIWTKTNLKSIEKNIRSNINDNIVKVITHNLNVEYGHFLHKQLSNLVIGVLKSLNKLNLLYVFSVCL